MVRFQCTLVHQVSGRVRLRVPELKTQPGLAEQLVARLRDLDGISAVRANPSCAALVVTFEASRISVAAILATLGQSAPIVSRVLHIVPRSTTLRPAYMVALGATAAVLTQVSDGSGSGLLDELREFVSASDLLDLALSAVRGEVRITLASIIVSILLRWLWRRGSQRAEPILLGVRPFGPARQWSACAA